MVWVVNAEKEWLGLLIRPLPPVGWIPMADWAPPSRGGAKLGVVGGAGKECGPTVPEV